MDPVPENQPEPTILETPKPARSLRPRNSSKKSSISYYEAPPELDEKMEIETDQTPKENPNNNESFELKENIKKKKVVKDNKKPVLDKENLNPSVI